LAIAQALVEAHRHRVLHRDLKPENVVLAKDGRLRLVDLGLAKVRTRMPSRIPDSVTGVNAPRPSIPAPGSSSGERVEVADCRRASGVVSGYATAAGTVQGTPAYMAPEQWRGEESSEATDIWAFGVILHELLVGRRPYTERNSPDLRAAILQPRPVAMLAPSRDLPVELVELVARCLEKDGTRRPAASQVVDALERLLSERRRHLVAEQSPFRGLFPFCERHADVFFGRDSEIAVFLESLRDQAVIPVVGPSGAGKSSFVQAGVIPRLREQGAWQTLTIRPGADPFGVLAARLLADDTGLRASESVASAIRTSDLVPPDLLRSMAGVEETARTPPAIPIQLDALIEQLRRKPEILGVFLHDLAVRERCKVLLFVDQLEETYTMVADRTAREAFIRAICRVADHPSSPVRAVFTIRDDFLGHLGGGSEVAAALARVFVLRRPSREGMEEVLTRPLAMVGYSYDDPPLVSEMVESVQDEPACLPLLQFAGNMLWERRDKSRRLLCRTTYEAMGGVAGSLAEHADGVLAGMTPAQIDLTRQLLLRLVTSAGTRRTLPAAAAVAGLGAGVEDVLEKLTQARLLTVRRAADSGRRQQGEGKGGSGEAVLDLVHESLVRTWRRLARWIEESHEELALLAEIGQAAELWEKRGRRHEEVWQGDALADARRKLARLTTKVPESVAQFVEAGLRKGKRQRRRKRLLAAGTMAFLVVVAVVSLWQREVAKLRAVEAQTQRARAEQREAEARRVGARAAFIRGELLEARAM
ncbi:MAG: serine/threonine-protein kinase, partial [Pseudomonadota bacterium]